MEVKVCKRCKKLYQHVIGPSVCPQCKKGEEEQFKIVKEYLKKNPGETIITVSNETGVPIGLIESFLRQGRLEVSTDSPMAISCEKCGKRISTGKYCNQCKTHMVEELNGVAKEIKGTYVGSDDKKETRDRMRYLQSDRIK